MNDAPSSFEEFQLYYQSTELVTDRRIATTRWNYSVGVAILGGIALLTNWSLANDRFLALGLTAATLIAGVAAAFSYLWLRQIDDYKALNNAKFEVLNEMAAKVRFHGVEPKHGDDLRSYEPFRREWERLSATKALVRARGKDNPITMLSAGNVERFLPKAFFALFSSAAFLCIVMGIANWSALTHSVTCVTGGLTRATCTGTIKR